MAETATVAPIGFLSDACAHLLEQWDQAVERGDDEGRGNVHDAYQIVWLAMMEVIGI